jgi:diguanylate cyclase (GGDEF)-like protein
LRNKELLDLLSKKAMIDGLTGLWNRRYFDQRLKEELAYAQRQGGTLSCIMVDIDHFKLINDAHGHGFGDLVLKQMGDVLQRLSRSEDVPCRYGGEEFAVLARGSDAAMAMLFADRLRLGIAENTSNQGAISVSVTASLGISDLSGGSEGLVNRADQALYQSKQDGRNRATAFTAAQANASATAAA